MFNPFVLIKNKHDLFMFIIIPLSCALILFMDKHVKILVLTSTIIFCASIIHTSEFLLKIKKFNDLKNKTSEYKYRVIAVVSSWTYTIAVIFCLYYFYSPSEYTYMFFIFACFTSSIFDMAYTTIKAVFLQRDPLINPNAVNIACLMLAAIAFSLLFFDKNIEGLLKIDIDTLLSPIDIVKLFLVLSPLFAFSTSSFGMSLTKKYRKELSFLAGVALTLVIAHICIIFFKPQPNETPIYFVKLFSISILICAVFIYKYYKLEPKKDVIPKYTPDINTIITILIILAVIPLVFLFRFIFASGYPSFFMLMITVFMVFTIVIFRSFPAIDQLIIMRDKYEKDARIDTLTGIPNRRDLMEHLEENKLLERTVIFIDVNDFKSYNDYYGHHFGDAVLMAISDELEKFFINSGKLFNSDIKYGRLGGDEFLINLHRNQLYKKSTAVDEIVTLLKHKFNGWKVVNDTKIYLSISVGASPWQIASQADLIKIADFMMLSSKANKLQKESNDAESRDRYQSRQYRREQILRSLQHDLLIPVDFQQIIDTSTNKIFAFEALARLKGDKSQKLYPKDFLDIIERDQLHLELLSAVIRSLENINPELQHIPVSLNISPSILELENIAQWIFKKTIAVNRQPQSIILELLETEGHLESTIPQENLQQLHQLGYTIALDDYGTGYSSLARITKSPISIVKIDRSLVLDAEAGNTLLLENVVELANQYNWTLIAEGLETENHKNIIENLGVNLMQGYYFDYPSEFHEFATQDFIVKHCLEN